MQIHLKEADLKTAVRDFIVKIGMTQPVGQIEFTATRGPNGGVETTVDLMSDNAGLNSNRNIGLQISEPVVLPDVAIGKGVLPNDAKEFSTLLEEALESDSSEPKLFGGIE